MKKGYKGKKKLSKKQRVKRNEKILRYSLLSFALVCLLLASFFTYNTYSLWNQTYSQTESNVVTAGCFELKISDLDENENSTAIKLKNTYPMSESRGLMTSPYILNLENICDVPSEYTIILNEFNNTTLSNNLIRYQIKKSTETTSSMLLSATPFYELDASLKYDIETERGLTINQSYNLAEGYLNTGESVKYELRIWLDYEATNDAMNKMFESGVTVISTSPQ